MVKSSSTSRFRMRMQPCEALRPMEDGTLVPWMPYPLTLSPIQRVPTGLDLPGATTLPLDDQTGSTTRRMIVNEPVGLGDLGAPTAVW